MEEVWMSEPVIVQTVNPRIVKPEDLESLVSALEDNGLDVRLTYAEQRGYGVTWWEVLLIWMAARTGEAVIDQVVGDVVGWMRARFRQEPEKSPRPKVALLVFYEDDEGEAIEAVELRSADDEPVRRPTEEFERYTRTKPPER